MNNNIIKTVVKKIIIPFSVDELEQQHNFINYLVNEGFCTAKIFNLYENCGSYYEVQEYIENVDKNYDIDDLIKTIANFHKLSKKYTKPYYKKNYYKMKFKCRGVTLYKILLNFSDKYFNFPMNNYKKNQGLIIDKICKKEVEFIINNYIKIYDFFIKNYYNDSCIIHNDITSNNVIFNENGIYLIDFDLSIIGTEYVDFIDAIIKRYNSIHDIVQNYEDFKKDFIKYINIYNKINNYVKLEIEGSISMLVLKLTAVHLYLLLNKQNIDRFLENNHNIFILIKKVINDLGIGDGLYEFYN